MDETSILNVITTTFDDVQVHKHMGYIFFFYSTERMMPFATIASNNNPYEQMSRLDRPSVFRLNIGVTKETYRAMFGPQPKGPGANGLVETGHDFAALDTVMPHPHYAPQSWICVLNPSEETFKKVRLLLTEAYDLVVKRHQRKETAPSET